jgi:hypothetical protein
VVVVELGLEVLPPQETSAVARTTVSTMTAKPRTKTAVGVCWRRLMKSATIAVNESMAKTSVKAAGMLYGGVLGGRGADSNMPLVGVPARVMVNMSVLLCVGLRVGGEKLQVNHAGSAALVSASIQENVIGPEKPPGFTVTVNCWDRFEADKLAELGETEPVGKPVTAKLMSATAFALAWLTQAMSAAELAPTAICAVPQVETSGAVGVAVPGLNPKLSGGPAGLKQNTDGLLET